MSLIALIKQRITAEGSISVADYMSLCLSHPDYGYYMRRDPLGAEGDFTTSPEISQVFGELIGLWLAAQWQKQGKPTAILAELGAGRGTLMADILRATKHVQGFHAACSVHLVEISPVLRQKQWQTLAGNHPAIHWHDAIDDVPSLPLFLVANEFFDALPIHQFCDAAERVIVLDETGNLAFSPANIDEQTIIETSPASLAVMQTLAAHIAAQGGAALLVDYGYIGGSCGDTLQAMKNHAYHPVLSSAGEADLTAHVDFDALSACATIAGAATYGAVPQGKFLLKIGASQRLMSLYKSAEEEQRPLLMSGFERIISPEAMGDLFKVLAVMPLAAAMPEGF